MLKAEVIETTCRASVRRGPSERNTSPSSERLITKPFLRGIGFQRRLRPDRTTLSYAKALKMTLCVSIEATIRKQRLYDNFFCGRGGAAKQ